MWYSCIFKYQTCLCILYKCTKEHGKAQEDSQQPYVSICNLTLLFEKPCGRMTMPVHVLFQFGHLGKLKGEMANVLFASCSHVLFSFVGWWVRQNRSCSIMYGRGAPEGLCQHRTFDHVWEGNHGSWQNVYLVQPLLHKGKLLNSISFGLSFMSTGIISTICTI